MTPIKESGGDQESSGSDPHKKFIVWSREDPRHVVDLHALPPELRSAVQRCAADGDGCVTVAELLASVEPAKLLARSASRRVSIVLNQESGQVIQKIDTEALPAELREAVQEYDVDGDGIITVDELVRATHVRRGLVAEGTMLKAQASLFKTGGILSMVMSLCLAALLIGVTCFVIYDSKDTYVAGNVATNRDHQPLSINVNEAAMSVGSLAYMPPGVAAKVREVTVRGQDGEDVHLARGTLAIKARAYVVLTATDGTVVAWHRDKDGGRDVTITPAGGGEGWSAPAGCETCTAVSLAAGEDVRAALEEFHADVGLPRGGRRLKDGSCMGEGAVAVEDWGGEEPTCPANFYLNPNDTTNKNTFLGQFKPCGYYKANCGAFFGDWFPDNTNDPLDGLNDPFDPANNILANVDYPGNGNQDLKYGVNLVQFDVGLDAKTFAAYQDLVAEYGEDGKKLIADTGSARYLDFNNALGKTGAPLWTSEVKDMELGETCVETFALTYDDWGFIDGEQHEKGDYDCMGKCGAGCGTDGLGVAKDCMKHDVCSYFKALALDESSGGFCSDFDCGDEAMQTVTNCWISHAGKDKNVICDKSEDDKNPKFYSLLNPAVRVTGKRACTLRTGWDRNQGTPWQRYEDGTGCTSHDDCQSRRCNWLFRCAARSEIGQRCISDNDCISLSCSGRWHRKCKK